MKRSLWGIQSHCEWRGVLLVYNSVVASCSLLTLACELRVSSSEVFYGKLSVTTAQLYTYFGLMFFSVLLAVIGLYCMIVTYKKDQ